MAQLRLEGAGRGQVAEEGDVVLLAFEFEPVELDVDGDQAARLVPVPGLEGHLAQVAQFPPVGRPALGGRVGLQVGESQREQFGFGITEQFARGAVDAAKAGIRRDPERRQRGLPHGKITELQGGFRAALGRDIFQGAEDVHDGAVARELRLRRDPQPDPVLRGRAIDAHDHGRHRSGGGEGLGRGLGRAGERGAVRMDDVPGGIEGGPAGRLIGGEPEQFQRPGVGQQNFGAGPLEQNADVQIFDQGLEALFGLTAGRGGEHAGRNILVGDHHPGPGADEGGDGHQKPPSFRGGGAGVFQLKGRLGAGQDRLEARAGGRGLGAGGERGGGGAEVQVVPPDGIGGGSRGVRRRERPAPSAVAEQDERLRIEHDDVVVDGVEHAGVEGVLLVEQVFGLFAARDIGDDDTQVGRLVGIEPGGGVQLGPEPAPRVLFSRQAQRAGGRGGAGVAEEEEGGGAVRWFRANEAGEGLLDQFAPTAAEQRREGEIGFQDQTLGVDGAIADRREIIEVEVTLLRPREFRLGAEQFFVLHLQLELMDAHLMEHAPQGLGGDDLGLLQGQQGLQAGGDLGLLAQGRPVGAGVRRAARGRARGGRWRRPAHRAPSGIARSVVAIA